MAWLYQRPDSKKWWIGFRKNGRQFLLSTKTTDKKEAEKKLHDYELIERHESDGRSNDLIIEVLTGKKPNAITLSAAANDYLTEAKGSTAPGTHGRYSAILGAFLEHLGASESRPLLRDIGPEDVRGYLAKRFATASAATANLEKKILSSFFRSCIKNQVLKENPVFPVRSFKVSAKDKAERRAFTVEEIRLLYSKAPDDFWRFMVLAGFYSGLRLGDLVLLRLGEIDFQDNVLRLVSGKAGKRMIIPMAAPLRKLLAEITTPLPVNDPSRKLWPEKAKLYEDRGSDPISKEFRNLLLVPAGLASKRNHRKQKNGRDAARDVGGPSFHCMRHSFVSFLKATGSNPAIARELAGHSSDMVNNLYTHIPQTALSDAINKLPLLEGGK